MESHYYSGSLFLFYSSYNDNNVAKKGAKMENLKKQSDICKKHFAAGLFTGIGLEEMALRKKAVNMLIADKIEDSELIEVFYDRVDRELNGLKTGLIAEGMPEEDSNEWAEDIRAIIEKSGFVDMFNEGVIVIE